MRLVSYLSSDGPRTAALRGESYVDLGQAGLPTSMRALLALGQEGLRRAARILG